MLERMCRETLDRLTRIEQTRSPSEGLAARVNVLQRLFVRETGVLSRAAQIELLRGLATSLGIESFAASGRLGVYQGSSRDYAVLARYAAYGTWDPTYQALMIEQLFADGRGTLIDVGANIGLTSIPVARERGITCYAFEPEPRSYLYLRQNVLANAVDSLVQCFNLALFSEETLLQFEVADGNMGDNRVRNRSSDAIDARGLREYAAKQRVIEVRASTLNAFFTDKQLEPPIVMKNDTQGSEVHVLRGASAFLPRVDYLISEFEPYLLQRIGDSVDQYIEAIAGFPYGAIQRSPDDLSESGLPAPPQLEPIHILIEKMKTIASEPGRSNVYANLILARRSSFRSK
jgi:FkbM family methyltransferase